MGETNMVEGRKRQLSLIANPATSRTPPLAVPHHQTTC